MGGDEKIDADYNGGRGEDEVEENMRSQSLSQQKSVKSQKTKRNNDDDQEDDYDANYQKYLYRAVASDRFATFQANLTEIYFELVQIQGGYFLRLETNTNQSLANQSQGVQNPLQAKRVIQQAF